MNDYDKAGRYLVKREPTGFFRWLLGNPGLMFRAWLDSRRVALPNQGDLTNDLVAALQGNGILEGICLELEAEARADALTRLLGYLARLWGEPGTPASLPLSCSSGVIVDFAGRSPARELTLRSAIAPGCRLELTVLRRQLIDEDGRALVRSVAGGQLTPWLLAWVPLMRGGRESSIIAEWLDAADRFFVDAQDRTDLATLTLTFATLAQWGPVWRRGLRGWHMNTSPFLDELRAEARVEGRAEGRLEGVRATLLRQGREKFGKAPNKKQRKALEDLSDLSQLEELAARLLHVDSWADLLNGLATQAS
jgi:hypothetical protein